MTASNFARVFFVALCLACLLPAWSAEPVKWTIAGYVQGRYTNVLGETPGVPDPVDQTDNFDIKRAYLVLRVAVDEHTGAFLMANGYNQNKAIELLEAYGFYTDGPYTAQLGLARIPFGYESPLSSAGLITLERSQVIQTNIYPFGFDRGVFGYYTPAKGLRAAAAVTNGSLINVSTDNNEGKNFIGHLGYPVPNGMIGASYYTGNKPGGTPDQQLRATGVDLQWKPGPFTVISEYLVGENAGADFRGYYVTVGYRKAGSATQPYIRYDVYDPDTDVAADNDFSRVTLGANHFLNAKTRVTLEYEAINDDLQPDLDGRVAFQYQVSFP